MCKITPRYIRGKDCFAIRRMSEYFKDHILSQAGTKKYCLCFMFSKVSSKNLIANKAKAVHTEVCTDACQPCDVWIKFARLLLNRIGSSVKICMVRVRERLSADNRLQSYNKNSNYTNKSIFCCHFFAFAHANHILSEYTASAFISSSMNQQPLAWLV